MVILKDMNYRRKLDLEVSQNLRKNFTPTSRIKYSLTQKEEKRLKSVFWGTNYTTSDIVKGIKENNQKILKRLEENLSFNMQRQIIGKLTNA